MYNIKFVLSIACTIAKIINLKNTNDINYKGYCENFHNKVLTKNYMSIIISRLKKIMV